MNTFPATADQQKASTLGGTLLGYQECMGTAGERTKVEKKNDLVENFPNRNHFYSLRF